MKPKKALKGLVFHFFIVLFLSFFFFYFSLFALASTRLNVPISSDGVIGLGDNALPPISSGNYNYRGCGGFGSDNRTGVGWWTNLDTGYGCTSFLQSQTADGSYYFYWDTVGLSSNSFTGVGASSNAEYYEKFTRAGGVWSSYDSPPSCFDEIQNQDETGIDIGGVCEIITPPPLPPEPIGDPNNLPAQISSTGDIPRISINCTNGHDYTLSLVHRENDAVSHSFGVVERMYCTDGIVSFNGFNINDLLVSKVDPSWWDYVHTPLEYIIKDTTGIYACDENYCPLINLHSASNNYDLSVYLASSTYWPTVGQGPVFETNDHTTWFNAENPPCTVDCFSNVLFLPGIKGSVLEKGTDTLWPPTIWSNDISQLEINSAGESVNDIHVKGILNSFYRTDIYEPFSEFMDDLVVDKTINEWLPLAYDWRFSPEKIIEDGIKTESEVLDVIAEIETLAENSKTGKVTIVAHSMGGLLGKAIIKKLQEQGKDDLVDSFVMIAAPQLGTPQAIASILHGDGEGLAVGFITNPIGIRRVAQGMPSAYNLLPSARYFDEVSDPVIKFNENAPFTQAWRNLWSETINNYSEFFSFMTGTGVTRTKPAETELKDPEVLSSDLMTDASNFHNTYDDYQFPEHIRVVQVAGWGRPTVKSIEYKMSHGARSYDIEPTTVEGDRTVVYPSAISSVADETYFFNLSLFNKDALQNIQHRDLPSSVPVQDIIKNVIKKDPISETSYIFMSKPPLTETDTQLIISSYSPVILGVYDQFENFTGVDPDQDLSAEILSIKEDIPGSTFLYTNESQNIFLPKQGNYNFVYKGIGNGPTTVTIDNFSADIITPIVSYTDMPTTVNTEATFAIQSSTPENTEIVLDVNGNGQTQIISVDASAQPSLNELIAQIKAKISTLTVKDKLKQSLLKRVASLEKRIENKKQKNVKILTNLKNKISKQEIKGKIDTANATEITNLLDLLEAQSDNIALDPTILSSLKTKIQSLSIKNNLKNDLLRRISNLEKKYAVVKTLSNLSKNITSKATKGKISDTDAQALIDLLTQIEGVI